LTQQRRQIRAQPHHLDQLGSEREQGNVDRSSGFMQRAPQLCGAGPLRFVSALRIDATRADCGARPPTQTPCGHAPNRGLKSDANLDVL
jgi:hypothetical protein